MTMIVLRSLAHNPTCTLYVGRQVYQGCSAGAIGLPWAFREHNVFSTDCYILDHGKFFETLRQFFRQCLLPFLCKLVITS